MNTKQQIILILDDDESVRQSYAAHFEDRGWKVMSMRTAEEALVALREENPSGAIVDIRLPGMDGNEFMREVGLTHPTLACVVCTGSPEYRLPDNVAILPHVSKTLFTKPVLDMAELEAELSRQIKKHDDRKN
jgi:DNA-binding NtrC family response regulator